MLELQVQGLAQAVAGMKDFSERRFRATVATALTRTAREINAQWRERISGELDRPLPRTRTGVRSTMATAQTLAAEVAVQDRSLSGGATVADALAPSEYGGPRAAKVFERALIAAGAMPQGTVAVPTRQIELDGYGNPRRRVIVQILNQLAGGQVREGYRQVISTNAGRRGAAAKRAGVQYVAFPQDERGIGAGIYRREGRRLVPVFLYRTQAIYPRRLRLIDRARQAAPAVFARQAERALAEQLARLQLKRAGGST